jgi:hypothetical protein
MPLVRQEPPPPDRNLHLQNAPDEYRDRCTRIAAENPEELLAELVVVRASGKGYEPIAEYRVSPRS